jgi:folate-binding Fe-S cluster repair protein YgfZ
MIRMAATTLTDRAVLRLSGEDVRGFLQGLVTNDWRCSRRSGRSGRGF